MPQQVLNPLTEYGRSGGILLLNPTDRAARYRYLSTPAELRSAPVIRGVPPTYQTPTAATVSTVAPATGVAAGGTAVTITGTGLLDASGVTFGGAAATNVTATSATTITCTTPAHAAGAVDVVVLDPSGDGTKSGGFTYT